MARRIYVALLVILASFTLFGSAWAHNTSSYQSVSSARGSSANPSEGYYIQSATYSLMLLTNMTTDLVYEIELYPTQKSFDSYATLLPGQSNDVSVVKAIIPESEESLSWTLDDVTQNQTRMNIMLPRVYPASSHVHIYLELDMANLVKNRGALNILQFSTDNYGVSVNLLTVFVHLPPNIGLSDYRSEPTSLPNVEVWSGKDPNGGYFVKWEKYNFVGQLNVSVEFNASQLTLTTVLIGIAIVSAMAIAAYAAIRKWQKRMLQAERADEELESL